MFRFAKSSFISPGKKLVWIIVGLLVVLSLSWTATAQTNDGGFGVGSGFGREVGINLNVLNQVRADINAGVYDRPCAPEEHDRTKWHSLVNVERKCHYDHMHGDDPNFVNDILGTPGAWFGSAGQSISYPWQTFKAQTAYEPNDAYVASGQMENDLKHEGYIWVVRRDQPCPNGNCVVDFRLQTHAIMGAHDMPVRFHSASLEARVCANKADPSTCGIMRLGGWVDMGRLFTTAPNDIHCDHSVNAIFIPLPADTLYFPIDRPDSRDEIRCHPNVVNLPAYPPSRPLAEWWGHNYSEFRFQLRSYDPIGNVVPSDPSQWHLFCAENDVNCRYNASIFSAFIGYAIQVPEFVVDDRTGVAIRTDSNGDGRMDTGGWRDRWGGGNSRCTAPGLDCIPAEYTNVVANFFNNKEARYAHSACESNCNPVDHDISPPGQRWITWYYRYVNGHHGTATPPPDVTPTATTPPDVTPTATTPPATTPAPTEPSLLVSPDQTSAEVGATVNVDLRLVNVENVYGLQAQCTVDPNVLTGAGREDTAVFNASNSFIVDQGFQPDGAWLLAASLLQPNPAFSGEGVAFRIHYQVAAAGSSPISCAALAVNQNGVEIPLTVFNSSFNGAPVATQPPQPTETPTTPPPPPTETPVVTEEPTQPPVTLSTITGSVAYQNHPDNAGIVVQLVRSDASVADEITTGADGAFAFADVPQGMYGVTAIGLHHLRIGKVVNVTADGQVIDLGIMTLPGGDTDNNGKIDLADAGLIGANFDMPVNPAPADADINLDGMINIRDLAIVGGNFGLTGPIVLE
jgi:hypothetical protein